MWVRALSGLPQSPLLLVVSHLFVTCLLPGLGRCKEGGERRTGPPFLSGVHCFGIEFPLITDMLVRCWN